MTGFRSILIAVLAAGVVAAPGAAQVPGGFGPVQVADEDHRDKVAFAPAPAFVIERALPATDAAELRFDHSGGIAFLLFDEQTDATGAAFLAHTRSAVMAVSHAGVPNVSQHSIVFDPTFQRVEINHVRVIRDGVAEDRSGAISIDVLRQEQLLHQQIYTGAATALIRFDDIRRGDIVDVGYTLIGYPPGFAGRESRVSQLGFVIPIEQFSLRGLWPEGVRWKTFGKSPEVSETTRRGVTTIEIAPAPLEALRAERLAFAPAWAPETPYLIASRFRSWKEVADWGRELYAVAPDPEVAALAARIAAEHDDPADRIVAALRFVQDDVRYFAMVLGEGGYTPIPPSETLRTRSGDCKAKTLLLLGLLDELGVEAHAAFVSGSGVGQAIAGHPPSPSSFDHVIVRVIHGGRTYWLDPTAQFHGGPLEETAQADLGFALPLAPGVDGLAEMAPPRRPDPDVDYRERITLFDEDAPDAVDIDVRVTFRHFGAELFRSALSVTPESEFVDSYLEYYEQKYDEAAFTRPVEIRDDRATNTITTTFGVRLPDAYAKNGTRRTFSYRAHTLMPPVLELDDDMRGEAVVLIEQRRKRHEVVLDLPDDVDWRLEDGTMSLQNPAFRFERRVGFQGDDYVFVAELEPLDDAVREADRALALEHQNLMTEEFGRFIWTDGGTDLPVRHDLAPLSTTGVVSLSNRRPPPLRERDEDRRIGRPALDAARAGDADAAAAALDAALPALLERDRPAAAVDLLIMVVYELRSSADHAEVARFSRRALDFALEHGVEEKTSHAFSAVQHAQRLFEAGDPGYGEYTDYTLDAALQLGEAETAYRLLMNSVRRTRRRDQTRSAADAARAAQLIDELPATGAAASLLSGSINDYRVLGDFDSARRAGDRALAIARQIKDGDLEAEVLLFLGDVARAAGDDAAACGYYAAGRDLDAVTSSAFVKDNAMMADDLGCG